MVRDHASSEHVAILMATYNGALYIREQLESILNQSHSDWSLWVSDDGSTDGTQAIVTDWARERTEKVTVINGPKLGFSLNFISLLLNIDSNAKYFAFCDQDDIWLPDKLERAIDYLQNFQDRPALYFARTEYIDEGGRMVGESPYWRAKPDLRFALAQNICSGNTMVMNARFRQLISLAQLPNTTYFWYDWWLYQFLISIGGECYFDRKPSLLYRRHCANVSPPVVGMFGRFRRLFRRLMSDEFKVWSDIHGKFLLRNNYLFTEANRKFLQAYVEARSLNSVLKVMRFIQLGIRRDSIWATLAYLCAVGFDKA